MDKFYEYYDCLMSLELSSHMARKYNRPLDKSVAQCARVVAMRCKDLKNRQVFLGVSKSKFPAAAVYQMRTMFDEMISS